MPRESRYLSRLSVIGAAITIILIFLLGLSDDKSLFVAKAELIDLLIYVVPFRALDFTSTRRATSYRADDISLFRRTPTPSVGGVDDKSSERTDCYRGSGRSVRVCINYRY